VVVHNAPVLPHAALLRVENGSAQTRQRKAMDKRLLWTPLTAPSKGAGPDRLFLSHSQEMVCECSGTHAAVQVYHTPDTFVNHVVQGKDSAQMPSNHQRKKECVKSRAQTRCASAKCPHCVVCALCALNGWALPTVPTKEKVSSRAGTLIM
jgi:hypothetical protein